MAIPKGLKAANIPSKLRKMIANHLRDGLNSSSRDDVAGGTSGHDRGETCKASDRETLPTLPIYVRAERIGHQTPDDAETSKAPVAETLPFLPIYVGAKHLGHPTSASPPSTTPPSSTNGDETSNESATSKMEESGPRHDSPFENSPRCTFPAPSDPVPSLADAEEPDRLTELLQDLDRQVVINRNLIEEIRAAREGAVRALVLTIFKKAAGGDEKSKGLKRPRRD
ncbi:hypothetical protein EJ02DRAFT_515719 [Clathrospora elynae]|uniref:Uncharacterized protein n=1 Tax=Clathrospora elynae TaxID=706981 RepID=A0A6A5S9L3_9PLEO|nr:hypothetical protein EJ02DRAFT_515719 [Clathrospora elynae]